MSEGASELPLSVIVPVGTRFDDPAQLCADLRRVLGPLAEAYEVIFVDDANGPNTARTLRETAGRFPEARVLRLQRRMGDAAALAVGAQASRGRVLITLDAYQHVAVDELPKLMAPLKDDVDLVCAWRYPRQERG